MMTTRRRNRVQRRAQQEAPDPAHAPGKRKRGAPRDTEPAPHRIEPQPGHDQPWVPTNGLVGRKRRSARRS